MKYLFLFMLGSVLMATVVFTALVGAALIELKAAVGRKRGAKR